MSDDLIIVELEQISDHWPCQWEGRLADDRSIYIRYRNNRLAVWIGEPGTTSFDLAGGEPHFDTTVDSPFGGEIAWPRVEEIAGVRFKPS